jgi:8-oxo-dGTP diphosphatase
MSEQAPIEAVVAILRSGDRFLFVRRAPHRPAGGWWCPVSGRIERGESERDAVAREVAEEVGAQVVATGKLRVLLTADGAYRLHYWLAEPATSAATPSTPIAGAAASSTAPSDLRRHVALRGDEATELGWFTLDELRLLRPTFPEDVDVCAAALEGGTRP